MAGVQEERTGPVTRAAGPVCRACSSLDDFRECVQLQKQVWGFEELEVLPARVFVVADEIGGQIFGAFVESPEQHGPDPGGTGTRGPESPAENMPLLGRPETTERRGIGGRALGALASRRPAFATGTRGATRRVCPDSEASFSRGAVLSEAGPAGGTPALPGKMIGFLVALPGIRRGKPFFHSHMLGVLPEWRDRGVGRRLKMMQRDDALARGVDLVEWTFDPLEPKNAFFNVARLGAVVRRYVPNRYGITTSGLHAGLPTDRLVAEWWVGSERVRMALEGRPAGVTAVKRIELPPDIAEIKKTERTRALEILARVRAEFQEAFTAGLAVAGFDSTGSYLLTSAETLGDIGSEARS